MNLEKITVDLKKIPRWAFQLFFLILAVIIINIYTDKYPPGTIPSNKEKPEETLPSGGSPVVPGKLKVTASTMCMQILDGWPSELKKSFSRYDGKVYCFTLIEGAESNTYIHHQWIFGTELMYDRRLTIDSPSCRTWSSFQLNPAYTGNWRVDVYSLAGEKMTSISFTVN